MIVPPTVTVLGDPEILSDLSSLNLGTIDLSTVLSEDTLDYQIPVPGGILLPADSAVAKVYVSFEGLEMTSHEVTEVEIVNVQEQLVANWEDPGIVITLRGPKQELDALTAGQVTVKADLSQYRDPGLFTVPVTVSTGSQSIAAIGDYTVLINITDYVEPEIPDDPDPLDPDLA